MLILYTYMHLSPLDGRVAVWSFPISHWTQVTWAAPRPTSTSFSFHLSSRFTFLASKTSRLVLKCSFLSDMANCLPLLFLLPTASNYWPLLLVSISAQKFWISFLSSWRPTLRIFFPVYPRDCWHFLWCDIKGSLGVGLGVKVKNTPSPAPQTHWACLIGLWIDYCFNIDSKMPFCFYAEGRVADASKVIS